MLGRAIAIAWSRYPDLNGKIIWGTIYQKEEVDVFFHVDLEDGKDLAGIVVRDAGKKSVVEIARDLREKAEKLRGGKDEQYEKTQKGLLGKLPPWLIGIMMRTLTFCEMELGLNLSAFGAKPDPFGTVMISNVARFGIDSAFAPLPTVSRVPCVVLMGRRQIRPWVVEGEVEPRPTQTFSGTFDHRFIDGNRVGKIAATVEHYISDPEAAEQRFADFLAGKETARLGENPAVGEAANARAMAEKAAAKAAVQSEESSDSADDSAKDSAGDSAKDSAKDSADNGTGISRDEEPESAPESGRQTESAKA
mgnify:CR=1 FL=1